jgi:hypothetical protein
MTHIGFRVSLGWITDMENARAGARKKRSYKCLPSF